ncbi:hypothetical protein AAY81_04910 [Denitrobacterium detoxificans]|uniref:Uncharacterized protein n=1 Tax=Denitrobacterium detoxificans TaxID=79604 RepID=A0A172RY74_9ACTN|nr:hypothetical protein [Denitrobacterium detoxificans]ANE22573.1 hypothetical protein AAY81_04910 [Denitrobacterium detoxificans]SEP04051.1 hypothetical protein SAMN02910314_01999 [Denitrobacterium detoxificans]
MMEMVNQVFFAILCSALAISFFYVALWMTDTIRKLEREKKMLQLELRLSDAQVRIADEEIEKLKQRQEDGERGTR